MSLPIEQLLMPRYLVIADYPGSRFRVNDILESVAGDKEFYMLLRTASCFSIECPLYPAIFRPMPWYEGRKVEEMPGYLKLVMDSKIQFVDKVEKWAGVNDNGVPLYEYKNRVNYQSRFSVTDLEPATEAEYISHINKTSIK